jgi:hypothetical protein
VGAPSAAPGYYALLLFAHFAQQTRGLRPVAVAAPPDVASQLDGWQLDAGLGGRRLFVVNRSARSLSISVGAPARRFAVDRMTPFDPTGAGRRLDAPQVRIDGRAVGADGRWPGFAPATGLLVGGRMRLSLGAGEAAVVSFPVG